MHYKCRFQLPSILNWNVKKYADPVIKEMHDRINVLNGIVREEYNTEVNLKNPFENIVFDLKSKKEFIFPGILGLSSSLFISEGIFNKISLLDLDDHVAYKMDAICKGESLKIYCLFFPNNRMFSRDFEKCVCVLRSLESSRKNESDPNGFEIAISNFEEFKTKSRKFRGDMPAKYISVESIVYDDPLIILKDMFIDHHISIGPILSEKAKELIHSIDKDLVFFPFKNL